MVSGRSPGTVRLRALVRVCPASACALVTHVPVDAARRGMVDAGEHVSATVRREFTEEAGNIEDPADRVKFEEMCNQLFGAGVVVYKGYVDEPRNTDNAWIETAVFHMHCPAEIGTLLPLNAGDDAVGVRWFDIDTENPNLYPPHRGWVGKVAAELLARGPG